MKKRIQKPRGPSHTVRYAAADARRLPVRFRKAHVRATTDKDIESQITGDPDTAPDTATLPESWRVIPRGIRQKLHMTQDQIARVLRISPATWRNWEQGRSEPYGPAAALLRVLQKNPKTVLNALRD